MATKTKLSGITSITNSASTVLDIYNSNTNYKDKNLVKLSIVLSTIGVIDDLLVAFQSPKKIKKVFSLLLLSVTLVRNVMQLKLLKLKETEQSE
ncbi:MULTISPECIES: hypothetical protein [Staphylococcus]|uniref:Uncharacterized protein n=1 Tax=Staphylococcus hsinchuensis TaxID=3051183 RepID=A0ABZ3EFX5_9STAP|nr:MULTISPECIES: hypothetical protein [unclassified Staphylococcus]